MIATKSKKIPPSNPPLVVIFLFTTSLLLGARTTLSENTLSPQQMRSFQLLYEIPPDYHLQELVISKDFNHFAGVLKKMNLPATSKWEKAEQKDTIVIHDGSIEGSYPSVIPLSLRISNDGSSTAFSVVKWRKYSSPIYWFVKDGKTIGEKGNYTDEVEFRSRPVPWFKPHSTDVAFVVSRKLTDTLFINNEAVFKAPEIKLHNPWDEKGKKIAFAVKKNGMEWLFNNFRPSGHYQKTYILCGPDNFIGLKNSIYHLYIEGKECLRAKKIVNLRYNEDSSQLLIAFIPHQKREKLTISILTKKCKQQVIWGNNRGINGIENLVLQLTGKIPFFKLKIKNSDLITYPLKESFIFKCGKFINAESITAAEDLSHFIWTVKEGVKETLCIDGRKILTRDKIFLPIKLYSTEAWYRSSFYSLNGNRIYREDIKISKIGL